MTELSKTHVVAWKLWTVSVLKNSVPAVLEQLPTSSQHNCEEKMGLRWGISTLCEFRLLSHPSFRPLRWNYRHATPESLRAGDLLHYSSPGNRIAKPESPKEGPVQVLKKKKKYQSSMKIFSPKLLIKLLTILYIHITDCHSIKIFFERWCFWEANWAHLVAIETFKIIKLLFLTTQSVKLH